MGNNLATFKNYWYHPIDDITGITWRTKPPKSYTKTRLELYYSTYKAKKYYKEVSDEYLTKHFAKIDYKYQIMKQYKHHEDFDRPSQTAEIVGGFYDYVQNCLMLYTIGAFWFSRMYVLNTCYDFSGRTIWYINFWRMMGLCIPFAIGATFVSRQFHVANHNYFQSLTSELAKYVHYDNSLDIYQDVYRIKYHTYYPSAIKYHLLKHDIITRRARDAANGAKLYYQILSGEKKDYYEEFIRLREYEMAKNKNKKNAGKSTI